jgi:predicted AlkP superfamily phosphohydrolase/phosphomutase
MNATPKGKLLIVGLDAGTLDLVWSWAEQDLLPHLSRLIREGVSAPMRSTIPAISPAAWTSMITGKNPGKHGVYDFIQRRPDSYHLQFIQPDLPRMGTLFGYLSSLGRRVGVMGVPSTYPPEPVNGFMISGPWAPPIESCVYPQSLFPYLQTRGYEINNSQAYTPETAQAFMQYLENTTDIRAAMALELLQREPWDFFMVVFRDVDTVSHKYWHDMDVEHPAHNPERAAQLGNPILKHYQQIDAYLGRMLAAIDEQTSVMIVSDHGAGPVYAEISINKWLLDHGFLALKRGTDWKNFYRATLRKLGLTRAGIISRLGWPLVRRLKQLLPAKAEFLIPWPHAQLIEQVDWSRTRAYSYGSIGQIHINLKGREPQGIVSPGEEYETLIAAIRDRLTQLVDPRTGRRVKVEIFRREDLYTGPFANQGPDLNLIFDDMSCITHITLDAVRERVIGPPVEHESGTHRLDGMLVLWGAAIQSGKRLDLTHITDVAPTALYLMNEAVPGDMDGQVLTAALRPGYIAAHPIETAAAATQSAGTETNWTPEEEAKIHQHLKDLGYLG